MKQGIVLSDALLKEYYRFQNGEEFNSQRIKALLNMYKPHLTSVGQLKSIGIDDISLFQSLAASNYLSQTPEELAELTTFKLILDEERTDFPYVNIYSDSIESNYTATYKDQERSKSIDHIKSLCANAKCIYIFDKYLLTNSETVTRVASLFPQNPFTLFYFNDRQINQNGKTKIKAVCPNIKFKQQQQALNQSSHHDRYLIIDQKIEIILTSGFENMFRTDDDFSYIVRELP